MERKGFFISLIFSVSDTEAGWHTDGASKDRVYDVVALLCVEKASRGGEFKLANAVNALESLKLKVPKFLLYELLRPIPRDVLENGSGKGHTDLMTSLCRSPDLLKLRVQQNAYPIFVESDGRMRFRYMRYWIETGFQKSGLALSPLLRAAMDFLDGELDKSCIFNQVSGGKTRHKHTRNIKRIRKHWKSGTKGVEEEIWENTWKHVLFWILC